MRPSVGRALRRGRQSLPPAGSSEKPHDAEWLAVLDEFATDLDATLALATDQERRVYESLAGPRA